MLVIKAAEKACKESCGTTTLVQLAVLPKNVNNKTNNQTVNVI